MATGRIQRILSQRRFGYIESEDGAVLFFDASNVSNDLFDQLHVDQSVEFDRSRDTAIHIRAKRAPEIPIEDGMSPR